MAHALLTLAVSNAASATVLAAVVAAVGWRSRRPALLHLLWLVVLLRLLAPPILELGVLQPAGASMAVAGQLALDATDAAADAPPRPADRTTRLERSAIAIWIAGSGVVGLLVLVRTRRFRRLLATARPAEAPLEAAVARAAEAVGCRRLPRAVVTDAPLSPQLWSGLGRPVLVLPGRLVARLTGNQLETIVAHELAHLGRGDHRVRWLEAVVLVIHWWNPTAWWACARLRAAEEACCDALVAAAAPARARAYASGLVEAVRQLSRPEPWIPLATSRLARGAALERRILAMFDSRPYRPVTARVRAALAAVALVALGLTPMLKAREAPPSTDAAAAERQFTGKPITLKLERADIRDVLATIAGLTEVDILVEPSVKATVSIEVENEPWDKVLDRIVRENNLTLLREGPRLIVRTPPVPDGELDGEPVYRFLVDRGLTEPVRLEGPNPTYPEAARTARVTGVVVLDCVIGADGTIHEVDVKRGQPEGLTEAAIDAVRQWTFKPATLEGEPVAVRYILTISFRLKEREQETAQ